MSAFIRRNEWQEKSPAIAQKEPLSQGDSAEAVWGQILAALGPPGSRGGKKLTDSEKESNQSQVDEVKRRGERVPGDAGADNTAPDDQ
jgi:hypothetical protein